MRSKIIKFLAATVTASALIIGCPGVLAQDNSIDESTLEKFAQAYADAQEINNEYTTRVQDAKDANKAADLQREAQEKMKDAVSRNGITLEKYQEIAQQVVRDPELRARVQAALR